MEVQLLSSVGSVPSGTTAVPLLLREVNEGGFAAEASRSLPSGVEHAVRFTQVGQEVILRARTLHSVLTSSTGDAPRFVIWFGFPRGRPEDDHRIAQLAAMVATSA